MEWEVEGVGLNLWQAIINIAPYIVASSSSLLLSFL